MQNKRSGAVPTLTEKKLRPFDTLVKGIIYLSSGLVVLMVVYFIGYIFFRGIRVINWDFLTGKPDYLEDTYGILPGIINTVYMIILSLLIAAPIGIGGAIYLTEYAKKGRIVSIIEFTIETLAGIPSIIFGVFGYTFFCVFMDLKVSIISGALTLTLIVLPTIIRTTQEALKSVPQAYREGALGMGTTKWYMIRTIILPSCLPGIVTAIILSVGRIVGESAALLLTAGAATDLPKTIAGHLGSNGATLTIQMYMAAYNNGKIDVAFGIATVILLIVLVLNLATKLTSKRLTSKSGK